MMTEEDEARILELARIAMEYGDACEATSEPHNDTQKELGQRVSQLMLDYRRKCADLDKAKAKLNRIWDIANDED